MGNSRVRQMAEAAVNVATLSITSIRLFTQICAEQFKMCNWAEEGVSVNTPADWQE
jgi:hypothetical protein